MELEPDLQAAVADAMDIFAPRELPSLACQNHCLDGFRLTELVGQRHMESMNSGGLDTPEADPLVTTLHHKIVTLSVSQGRGLPSTSIYAHRRVFKDAPEKIKHALANDEVDSPVPPKRRRVRPRKSRKGGKGSRESNLGRNADRLDKRWSSMGVEEYRAEDALHASELPCSSSGWMGKPVPKALNKVILGLWEKAQLGSLLKEFTPVAFAVILLEQYDDECGRFVSMWKGPSEKEMKANTRGEHLFCVAGHHRNNLVAPSLTRWHRQNEEALQWFFRANGPADQVTRLGSAFVRRHFPAVAKRFQQCAQTLKIQPLYGLFFNYCLNFPRPGVPRVHCRPHVDSKNIALGVCLIYIHGSFNHKETAWLVVWEAKIIIQIPPGVFVAYPSSLFYHFNYDCKFYCIP
ncbi:hypothetical protein PYCCODRAFT_1422577 [Trametes coccinea BRFM310]|uniref:Uncharacterized protein n=1 Tax=Trametes coccinea (strain BRFM310) TaxID=1353009 RepID=A0A1Y2IYQ1_TRAC3|nr:hypothetical protein PYCCODRAFT_1422577 [Trametes coccinea BRFM310]